MFESFVNSEEYQTEQVLQVIVTQFESFVNSEEYQTKYPFLCHFIMFESFVNSEEYQTFQYMNTTTTIVWELC